MTEAAKPLYKAIEMARIAKLIPSIPDPSQSPVKGALLELMLPGLHLLTLVSVMDEALSDYIEDKGIPWPGKTKRDLFNRINVVSKFVPTLPTVRLHRIREMRNCIAHSLGAAQDQTVTWAWLDDAMTGIAEAFAAMELIESTPEIVAFYERKPTLFAPNPTG
jgi:hypothetical protein